MYEMRLSLLAFFWVACLGAASSSPFSSSSNDNDPHPFGPGLFPVGTIDVGTASAPNASLSPWHAKIYIPNATLANRTNIFPVVLFVTGFGGEGPLSMYDDLLSQIASRGVAVIGVDRKFKFQAVVNYTMLADRLGSVLSFISSPGSSKSQLQELIASKFGSGIRINETKIILAGHSAGNHVTVRRVTSFGCNFAGGMILIDPVDGEDPFGIVKQYVIHPPAAVNFIIPALHIETGLDPVKANAFMPPCAPAAMSNARFYDAWRGPVYQLNATRMGHMDLANGNTPGALSRIVCASHRNASDIASYRHLIAGVVSAFAQGLVVHGSMDAHLEGQGNTSANDVLSGKIAPPTAVLYAQKNNPEGTRPTCASSLQQ